MSQVVTNTTDLSTMTVTGNTSSKEVDLKMRNPRWVKLYNASPFFLTVNTKNTEFHSLAPGEEDLYSLDEATPVVSVQATAQLNLNNPPATALISVSYDQIDRPPGSFPTFSNTFVGIGNVAPLNTVASELLSTGSVTGTEVIHVVPSTGFIATFIQMLNDGTFKFFLPSNGSVAGTPFLQILPGGGAGVFAALSFDFNLITSDGQGNLTGNRFLANDRFRWIKALGGATQTIFDFSPSGGTKTWSVFYGADDSIRWNQNTDNFEAMRWSKDKSGTLSAGQITWDTSGQLHMPNYRVITGTGPGTFAHGLGTTPNIILIMPNNAAAQSWAVNTITATQFTLAIGVGVNWSALVANVT